ncbi:prostacyclin synthase [Colletotrichum karsti]|uniref:Prostacyclin synthase n=1 Tax=Colletotrichum karsti TaxID=1095194 RepID=A0A9P6LHM1_9PEZI|nr:prostacyclin synthase [Colletotrichum karsti]KAF9873733.1 prostacyclin synthase [Colletotrichum karsti]
MFSTSQNFNSINKPSKPSRLSKSLKSCLVTQPIKAVADLGKKVHTPRSPENVALKQTAQPEPGSQTKSCLRKTILTPDLIAPKKSVRFAEDTMDPNMSITSQTSNPTIFSPLDIPIVRDGTGTAIPQSNTTELKMKPCLKKTQGQPASVPAKKSVHFPDDTMDPKPSASSHTSNKILLGHPNVPYVSEDARRTNIPARVDEQTENEAPNARSNKPPAFTLPMLKGKVYVVTDPALVLSVLRNRSFTFDPFMRGFIQGLTGTLPETMDIWDDPTFYGTYVKIVWDGMAGNSLLQLNVSVIDNVAKALKRLEASIEVENLYEWNRKLFTVASTNSLYGSKNPFGQDETLVEAYWTYESQTQRLIPNILPSLVAPSGHRARRDVLGALTHYFEAGDSSLPDVPPIVRDRRKHTAAYNIPAPEAASLELAFIHGAISNTFPTYYWLFAEIFSRPDLVASLRAEAAAVIEETAGVEDGKRVVILHANKLQERCPLLMSCFRETHRLYGRGILFRKVLADTTISDGAAQNFLLKKGWTLHIPQEVLHLDDNAWGEDANEFVGERFLKMSRDANENIATFTPKGFVGFGGGKHICPGRHFASGELLGSMVLLLVGFDVTSMSGGAITVPKTAEIPLTGSHGKPFPGSDLRGIIRRRAGWENVYWKVVA